MLLESFAIATHDAEKDEDLYPFKKPSLLANIKLDLYSVKLVSVLIISFFSSAASSASFKNSIFFHNRYQQGNVLEHLDPLILIL